MLTTAGHGEQTKHVIKFGGLSGTKSMQGMCHWVNHIRSKIPPLYAGLGSCKDRKRLECSFGVPWTVDPVRPWTDNNGDCYIYIYIYIYI